MKTTMIPKKPLVLVILDGWGHRDSITYNAIAMAKTPHWDKWWKICPHKLLEASGRYVGLPEFQMGSSEVGHMHIGAGRIIPQDFTHINTTIDTGEFFRNPILLNAIADMKASKNTLHIMGLLSSGGVHSHENHLFAVLKLCYQQKFNNVCLHLFLDGRDSPPQSALASISRLNQYLDKYPVAQISSITGRYFAMDRDNRWERIALVYRLLTEINNNAPHFANAESAIESFYRQRKYDEFIVPTNIGQAKKITDGDSIFFFNFRADRACQLTQAFIKPDFNDFIHSQRPALTHFISMTHYANNLATECVFPKILLHNTLGEVIAKHNLHQLRIAETEKYAHVTFFLNGGSEQIFKNEDRILIPSPQVTTYNLLPEMNAPKLTHTLIDAIKHHTYDVIICNYANADMVGHSGDFQATVAAIECLDNCLYKVWKAIANAEGTLLITADHGNAELMFDESNGQAHTAHTNQPVPLLYIDKHIGHEDWYFNNITGSLCDIAPTMLALLGINQPVEMTGNSLLVPKHVRNKGT